MEKKYMMVSESNHGNWKFENQTTACVIKLSLDDKDDDKPSEIWMDYRQWEQLTKLVNQVNQHSDLVGKELLPCNILNADPNLFFPAEGYRVPALEEFVQGFEFEYAYDSYLTVPVVDEAGNNTLKFTKNPRTWVKASVTWKHDPNTIVTSKVGEYTVHALGSVLNFFEPFNVESMLAQGFIRAKIK